MPALPLNTPKFTGKTTAARKKYFDSLWADVRAIEKKAGKNISISRHPTGTVINANRPPTGVTPFACCDLSLVAGITAVNLGLDLKSECCLCSPDCVSYERITGRTWTRTTSDPPEVDKFLFRCYDSTGFGDMVLDFVATSHAFGIDNTGRGVIVETNDSDVYWINADIGYLSYSPFPPECGKIAVAPYVTVATFDGCDDVSVVTFPPEIGASYTPAELIGTHNFTQHVECTTHPGKFWDATWAITFS